MGRIFVVSGPAGVGKNTVIQGLNIKALGLTYVPSFTTRKPRLNEVEGQPYYFLSLQDFMYKVKNGDFIEHELVHGNWYGTDKLLYQQIMSRGDSIIKDIDVNGALNLRRTFGESTTLIYIAPPSIDELKDRITKRGGGDTAETDVRLSRADMENDMSIHFDLVVVNEDLDKAVERVRSIILNNF